MKDQHLQKLPMVVANDIFHDLVGSMSVDYVVNACDEVGIRTKAT